MQMDLVCRAVSKMIAAAITGRSMHIHNTGTGINSNIGCNNREKYFNAGLIWNNDINKNVRGSNAENGQNFDNNIGFNYGMAILL